MRLSFSLWFVITSMVMVASVPAQEVTDLYSDLQSCDVTVEGDAKGCKLEVDLLSPEGVIQSDTLSVDGPGTWIVRWNVPQANEGSYSICARLLKEEAILSDKCYNFYYGGRTPIRFDVRDFRADYRGMNLLIYSGDLAVVDVYYMLIKGDKALYVKKEDSVAISNSVRSPSEFSWEWKQLLENNQEYAGRVKIVEKKNDQTRAFMNSFIARDDAEITDTYEDETGASATVMGRSRVPFEGSLRFDLYQNEDYITSVEKKTPILLNDDDETVEISWNETLNPGLYQLNIILLGNDGDVVDFEESIIEAEIPPRPPAVETEEEESPMTSALFGIVILISVLLVMAAWRRRS